MPYDSRTMVFLNNFQTILGEIQSMLDSSETNNLIIGRDFNSDPNKNRTWRDLRDCAAHNSLMIEDLKMPADSYTYFSSAHNTTTWIDHFLFSRQVQITQIKILYDKA